MGLPQEKPGQDNQPQPGQTRRVTTDINTDWQYLRENNGFRRSDRAANDRRYLTPETPTTDETFSQTAHRDKILGPVGLAPAKPGGDRTTQAAANDSAEIEYQAPRPRFTQKTFYPSGQAQLKHAPSLAKEALARAKASTVNAAAFSWQAPLYFWVQLPFAIFGLITLGVVGAVDSLSVGDGGVISWVTGKVIGAAGAIASLVGFDFTEIAFALFMISYLIVYAFGIISLFSLYFQYTIGRLRPLSGEAGGLKMGLLLLAIIGYSVPVANLFPFVLPWMLAVWWYPK